MPHRSNMYVDAACCYRPSSVICRSVCWSVTLVSPAKTAEPIEMPFGLRTWVEPGNHILDGGPDTHGKGQFWGGKGASHTPIVKYRDILQSSVQKRQNQPRCRLGYGLGWVQGNVLDGVQILPWEGAILGERGAHSKV